MSSIAAEGVLVIKRLHVVMRLKAEAAKRETADRDHYGTGFPDANRAPRIDYRAIASSNVCVNAAT